MAYKLFPFHNLGSTVGKGGINRSDDVRLVQALIEICIGADRSLPDVQSKCKELGAPSPSKKLAVNGNYTDDLACYIEMVQRNMQRRGQTVTIDGKVSPVPVVKMFDLATRGRDYTLVALNRTALDNDYDAFVGLGDKLRLGYAGS